MIIRTHGCYSTK